MIPAAAPLQNHIAALFRTYASVLFCDSPWVGAWFAALTWWSPNSAAAGLTGLLAAAFWGRLLGISPPGQPHLVNGLLTGLLLGAVHAFGTQMLLSVFCAALIATLSAGWFAALLWQAGKLPALSLAFVTTSWLALLAAFGGGLPPALLPLSPESLFPLWLDEFFISLSWLLLVPDPTAGVLLFAGLAATSPYLALLAAAGYAAGVATLGAFGHGDVASVGFNFMLAAMALGGIFAVPGGASFLLALGGGALAGVFVAILDPIFRPLHLPLLTLPFLLSVWIWLGGLGVRIGARAPQLSLDHPELPERAFERIRLAKSRGVATTSVPLLPPFYGQWQVSQAFDGPHTHRPPWQHALDFHIVDNGLPCRSDGGLAEDYYCFGAPVLAPAAGQVTKLRDDLPDMPPGEVDVKNNWGNFLLLRTLAGDYVLLAHLRQGSLKVKAGEWLAAGQPVAACGSSGRSPIPHLHLHVQSGERLGNPTRPFHLVNALARDESGGNRFHLHRLPAEGEEIGAVSRDERLAAALHLPAENGVRYELRGGAGAGAETVQLKSAITLLGQSRLTAEDGASAAFEETAAVLAYYDRQGEASPLLDLWLLALGLTPLSAAADRWRDRPAVALLPLGPWRRLLLIAFRPLGGGCDSAYQRTWDNAAHAWRQDGEHRLRPLPGLEWRAMTSAWIAPGRGVIRLQLDMFGRRMEANLLDSTQDPSLIDKETTT